MNWIFFALLAATCWASVNILDKIILSKLVKNPLTPIVAIGAFLFPVVLLAFLFAPIDPFTITELTLAFIAGLGTLGMNVCYVYAIRKEDVTKLIPLFGLCPVFIAIFAGVMLHEIFQPVTYAGIALILIGSAALSTSRFKTFKFNSAFWLMVGAAASISVTEIIGKYLLGSHGYWSVFTYIRLGGALGAVPIIWLYRGELVNIIRQRRTTAIITLTISNLLDVAGVFCIVVAGSLGYITLVNSVSQAQPFIVLLMSIGLSFFFPRLLKEEQSWQLFGRRFGSTFLIFIGVVVLVTTS